MILALVNVSSSPEKCTEVIQTLSSLTPLFRDEQGCLSCELCQSSDDDTAFTLVQEWRSRQEFDEHLHSRVFRILLGLGPLLKRPVDVSISTVVSGEGMESTSRSGGCMAAY